MRNQNFIQNKPLLYLIATPIGNLEEMSPRAINILKDIDIVACEDTRNTYKLLSFFNISKTLISLREHNEVEVSNELIEKIKKGKKVAYVSDAGYPCISDPGARLVKICLENEINVSTISGANAALNALVASGINSDHFYFHGFLNAKPTIRKQELIDLQNKKETLIFYESPHRIDKTLLAMYQILGNRKACIARELTKKHEEFIRMGLEEMSQLDPATLIGEMVIVVEGKKEDNVEIIEDKDVILMVENFINNGMSTKDAIKKTADITQLNKNYIYKIFHIN